jgi:hypothetical protein
MKRIATFTSGWKALAIVVVLAGWFLALPATAVAQSQGNNAVYYQSGSSGTCCQGSGAFIDASAFSSTNQGSDFCQRLNYILTHSYPSSGAVIDARGLNSSITGFSMTCATGWTPWNNGSTFVNVPSTILLPAGTIVIPTTWVLPNKTTLIGVGDALPSTSSASSTAIQACKQAINGCSFTGSDMIDLGTATLCPLIGTIHVCNSVSVENLTLDGLGQTLNGIVNTNAQTGSYVDHVSLYQLLGTGLSVSSAANISGPYSNITFNTGTTYASLSSTVCASINGLVVTRGIHGLNCTSGSNTPLAAVLLDSSNNSIEDVRIEGFYDGIRVGANANAQSNVLVNVIGDTDQALQSPTPIIVVHITSAGNTVSDLSIMGANNAGGSPSTITIKDDLTGTSVTDTAVGVYALGRSKNGGYSRFTTSTSAATWGVGSSAPGSTTCSPGSLYSNTSGSPKALYACLVSTSQWSGIK